MKIFLVTGGAGFIGSHLCERLLAAGHRVVNLDNFNDFYSPSIKRGNISKALSHPNYVLLEGDIRDRTIVDGILECYPIDTIVHLAALAGVRKSLEDPLEYIDVDIKGTVNLLEAARKHTSVKKFVFASSSSVYGAAAPPFREENPVSSQISPYAASKASGELFCQTYSSLYDLPTVCLRFFTVYGPRQRPEMAIHSFTRCISEGCEVPLFGDGTSSRDYTYIDDILDGILAAADLDCCFEIFNLGNSSSVRLGDLVDMIGLTLGKPVRKVFLKEQAGDVPHTFADIGKAESHLGFSPKVKIEEGISKFVQWFLK